MNEGRKTGAAATKLVLVGLVAGLTSGLGCNARTRLFDGIAGNGTAVSAGMAGSTAGSTAGVAGPSSAGVSGGGATGSGLAGSSASTGGAAGQSTGGTGGGVAGATGGGAGSGGPGGATGGGDAGARGTGLGFGGSDLTKVVPTPGCGMDPGQALGTLVRYTIQTSGTKAPDCADSKCGAWSYVREYFLQLPAGYDNTIAYPLLIEGTGNAGRGNQLYALPDLASTAIRVGLTPPPIDIGHVTNPNQGCYDDREGDDSVEWPFYENLYDKLAATVCFDRNRVFAAGPSTSCGGAWLANDLGCKYAGDPTRPVRGVMVNNGGLPTEPTRVPTCTNKPMSGMWVHSIGNFYTPFKGNIVAMNRALEVNGCTPTNVTYETATFDPFPISATDNFSCKKYRGCPDRTPLVVCPLPGNDPGRHEDVVNPGWATFLKLFSAPPLLSP